MSAIGKLIFPYAEDGLSTVSLNRLTFTDDSDSTRYSIVLNEDNKQVTSVDKIITQTQQHIPELTQYIQNPSLHEVETYPLLIRINPLYHKLKLNVSIRTSSKESKSLVIVKTKALGEDNIQQIKHILYENKEDTECQVSKIDYADLPLHDSVVSSSQRLIINDFFDREFINDEKLDISLWELDSITNEYTFLSKFSVWIDKCVDSPKSNHESKSPVSGDDKSMVALTSPISTTTTTTVSTSPVDHHGTSKQFKISDFKKEFVFNIDDGPEFRTTLTKYETNFSLIKKNFHQFNDEVKSLELTLKKLHHSKVKVIELVRNLVELQFNSLLRQFGFTKDFETKLRSIFDPFEKNLKFFLKDICDPKLIQKIFQNLSLNNLGEQNSSSSSSTLSVSTNSNSNSSGSGPHNELLHRRKQFESNSKDYYNWLNKYLSNEKERPESKLLIKRKSFELSKFDYLNQLNQVTNNQYLNQLMESLFKFINISYDPHNPRLLNISQFEDLRKSQDLISNNYKIYLYALSRFNSEKYQFRQMIEASKSNDELTNTIRYNKLNYSLSTQLVASQSSNSESSAISETPSSPSIVGGSSISFDDILVSLDNIELIFSGNSNPSAGSGNNLSESPSIANEEEKGEMNGILYTLGGQGKQGWHKEWVVLNKGLLIEFSDWRKGRSPINQPIEIALSSIKPITYDKRQNCFEILTSKGNKHVFQALNEADRLKWIKALYNAGQVVDTTRLKESYSEQSNSNGRTKKIISKLKTEFHIPQSPTTIVVPGESQDRSISPVSITSTARHKDEEEKDYLNLVKSIPDSDNHICLDCGSTDSVEWISINNLACFCVKCASCHRNIGSHITKIRSLKLDKFENESEMLLNYINNRKVNEYLEESLPREEKIGPNSSDAQRLDFIKRKYVDKKYKSIIPDINTVLMKAIQKINIPEVLRCIICGADVDLKIQISNPNKEEYQIISIFEYSLRKFVEISEADLILTSSKKYFLISEILILNGSKIDEIKDLRQDIGLTDDAAEYWKIRSLKLSGGFV